MIFVFLKATRKIRKIPKLKTKLKKKVLVTAKPNISKIFTPEMEISDIILKNA